MLIVRWLPSRCPVTISAVAALIKLKLITYWTGLVDETLVDSAKEECWDSCFVFVAHILNALFALLKVLEVFIAYLFEEVVIFEFFCRGWFNFW